MATTLSLEHLDVRRQRDGSFVVCGTLRDLHWEIDRVRLQFGGEYVAEGTFDWVVQVPADEGDRPFNVIASSQGVDLAAVKLPPLSDFDGRDKVGYGPRYNS